MRRWLCRVRAVQVSGVALALALGLVCWTLWRATHFTIATPTGAPPGDPTPLSIPAPVSGYSLRRVLAAIGKDPFHPERRRPGQRFQLPADAAAAVARGQESRTTEASLHLIGTAVASEGGGFAMCAWQGGSPRIVRVGERVGDWTLRKVTPGAAEFATPAGTTVVVHVPKAGT